MSAPRHRAEPAEWMRGAVDTVRALALSVVLALVVAVVVASAPTELRMVERPDHVPQACNALELFDVTPAQTEAWLVDQYDLGDGEAADAVAYAVRSGCDQ